MFIPKSVRITSILVSWYSGRSVLVEYVMLAGINDSDEVAKELGELLKDQKVVLSYYLGFHCFATGTMMEFDAYKWIFQCPIM